MEEVDETDAQPQVFIHFLFSDVYIFVVFLILYLVLELQTGTVIDAISTDFLCITYFWLDSSNIAMSLVERADRILPNFLIQHKLYGIRFIM